MTESLNAIFAGLDRGPSTAAYADAARRLRRLQQDWRPVRVALLSSFTIDLLVPYVEVESARCGLAADVYVAPFDTVQQELLSPESGCLAHRPDVLFVSQLLADACPPLVDEFLDLSSGDVEQLSERVLTDTASALSAFRERSDAALVVCNFALPPYAALGLSEVATSVSQTETHSSDEPASRRGRVGNPRGVRARFRAGAGHRWCTAMASMSGCGIWRARRCRRP